MCIRYDRSVYNVSRHDGSCWAHRSEHIGMCSNSIFVNGDPMASLLSWGSLIGIQLNGDVYRPVRSG